MYTRREFLASSASAGVGLASAAAAPSFAWARTAAQGTAPAPAPYIGYLSVRRDNRISIFTMDPGSGKVAWQEQVRVEGGPDPMVFDPRGRFLYVACRDRQQLSSYRIDSATGGLSLIDTVPLQGEPIQIVTDRTGRYLLSVFFYQSTIGVHAINDGGWIAFPPIEWRYTAYGCHGIEIDPSNRYVFVPHVARSGGPNAVAQFHFDERSGRLTPNTPAFLSLHDNEGPRHLLVHPTLNRAYSADEQGCSATAYRLDQSTGTLTKLQSISTVPRDYTVKGQVTCSELLIHPNGRLLFVVTREHNSIASFAIDQTTGMLSDADRVPTEPDVRPLCLDPSGRFMTAAGSGGTAGRLVTYEVDAATGKMTPLEAYDAGNGPMWILMMRGPGSARG
ncbi:MAG TPA: beta-propeller fold lactonase family protein [Vicinamibacterales bacterium]|jgi:6-phosphogluconolactonase